MAETNSRRRFTEYLDGVRSQRFRRRRNSRHRSTRQTKELIRSLLGLLHGQRQMLVLALSVLTIAMLMRLLPPVAVKLVVDYVMTQRPLPPWLQGVPLLENRMYLMYVLAIGGFLIAASTAVLRTWSDWMMFKSVQRLQVKLRKRAFRHAIRLPLHRIHEIKSGGTISMLRVDADASGQLIRSLMSEPWQALVQIVGCIFVLTFVDWRMLAGLAVFPLVYLTHRRWIGSVRSLFRDIREQREKTDAIAVESMSGIRIVRLFGRESYETRRFVRENLIIARQMLFAWRYKRVINFAWALALPVVSLALLLYGGHQVLRGHLTMGDVTMFLVLALMLLNPLARLINNFTEVQNNLAALERLLDLIEEPPELPPSPGAVKLRRGDSFEGITFRDVTFYYPNSSEPVLRDINLDIQAGETIALVGRSGAGKTTLCHLVSRLYDPTEGQLLLNGRDLRDFDVASYRQQLAIVEQDVFLFDGTVRDNIAYARPEATAEEVRHAARMGGADLFIREMPDAYETIIGERGVKLSGGQRQRLAIARALLADPKLLILDEATSNLDSETEQLIQHSLQVLARDRTSLVIAHRLSTIAFADRIVVLEQGRIVEVGTHQRLMAESGFYREMVELQTSLEPA